MATITIKTEVLRKSYPLLMGWLEKGLNRNELIETASFSLRDDDSRLTQSASLQRELENWMHKNPGSWRYEQPAAAPTPPPPPQPQTPTEPQIDMAEIEHQEKAEIQKAVHRAEAENRLADYERGGLLRNEHNLDLITEFVNNSETHGYWSAQIVDIAIQYLRARLNWRVVQAPPPPPPPPQPAPSYFVEGEVCSDGEPRLRIDIEIPQRVQKNCTPAQLRDLVQRSSPEWTKGFRDSSRAGRAREDRMPSHRVNF